MATMAGSALVLGVIGQGISMFGGLKAAKAEQKIEKLRERQMQLEADRKRRENIRQAMISRADVVSSAVAQGAGSSSALEGGIAGIQNQAGRQNLAVTQDQTIGQSIFKQNRNVTSAKSLMGIGEGISSIGSLFGNYAASGAGA